MNRSLVRLNVRQDKCQLNWFQKCVQLLRKVSFNKLLNLNRISIWIVFSFIITLCCVGAEVWFRCVVFKYLYECITHLIWWLRPCKKFMLIKNPLCLSFSFLIIKIEILKCLNLSFASFFLAVFFGSIPQRVWKSTENFSTETFRFYWGIFLFGVRKSFRFVFFLWRCKNEYNNKIFCIVHSLRMCRLCGTIIIFGVDCCSLQWFSCCWQSFSQRKLHLPMNKSLACTQRRFDVYCK